MSNETQKIHHRLVELIQPLINTFDLHLWGMEVPISRRGVLRIYIDGPDGVTIDQCAEISKHINILLDVEDPLPGPYTLEVSSPGLERPFFHFEQIQRYVDNNIFLKLKNPVQGSRKWRGILLKAENNTITLKTQEQEIFFPWQEIQKAHLIYER